MSAWIRTVFREPRCGQPAAIVGGVLLVLGIVFVVVIGIDAAKSGQLPY